MTEYILNRYNIEHDCDQKLLEWGDIDEDQKFKSYSIINLHSEKDTIEEQIEETLDMFQDDFNSYDYTEDICRDYINMWRDDRNICYLEIFLEYKEQYGDYEVEKAGDGWGGDDLYDAMMDRCRWFICQEALRRQRESLIHLVLCEQHEAVHSIQRVYKSFKEKQRRQAVVETITSLAFPIDIERQILDWDSVALYSKKF